MTKAVQGSGTEMWRGGRSICKGGGDGRLLHSFLEERILCPCPVPETRRDPKTRGELPLHTLFTGRGADCWVTRGSPL